MDGSRVFPPVAAPESGEIGSGEKATESTAQKWRSAVRPFRPKPLQRLKMREYLPGQRLLPGMEDEGQSAASGEAGPPVCPNCGSTEFDEDGDCAACPEPGVKKL